MNDTLTPVELAIIFGHAERELRAVRKLIDRGPVTPDDFKDVANGLRQVAGRYDAMAEGLA